MTLAVGRKWSPGFFQAPFVNMLAEGFQTSPHALVWEHTMMPYATAFLCGDVLERVTANVFSTGPPARGVGSTVQSVSDYVRKRRYCPECIEDDLSTWGHSYWHRTHHLPGAVCCVRHTRRLVPVDLPTTGRNSWSIVQPDECMGLQKNNRKPGAFLLTLSQKSCALLERPQGELPVRQSSWYRQRLQEKGLVAPGRSVNAERLIEWVRGTIGIDPVELGLSEKDATLNWVPLMIREGAAVTVPPVKHLLLETALELGTEAEEHSLTHVPKGCNSRPRHEEDRKYAKLLAELTRVRIRQQKPIRVREALELLGVWGSYRHDTARYPLLTKAVMRLRASPASARKIVLPMPSIEKPDAITGSPNPPLGMSTLRQIEK